MAQILVNGAIAGAVVALIAAGFAVIYFPTRVFALDLAVLYVGAPSMALTVLKQSGPAPVAIALGILGAITFALLSEHLVHRPMAEKNSGSIDHMIAALGVYIVGVAGLSLLWGPETKSLRTGLDLTVAVGGLVVTGAQLLMLSVTGLALGFVYAFLYGSNLGLRYRALASDPIEYELRGLSVRPMRSLSFVLGGTLVAIAGMLNAYDTGWRVTGGLNALLLGIVAAVVGGTHGFVGVLVASLAFAIGRGLVVWLFSAQWQEVFTYGLLGLFLLLSRGYALQARSTSSAEV